MLIWHRIDKNGRYNMRTNMLLFKDMNHLKNALNGKFENIQVVDMAVIPGNKGLFRVLDATDGEIIGEAYDPDVYRVWPDSEKEMVVPAYKDFFDSEGKFSEELFKKNYRLA